MFTAKNTKTQEQEIKRALALSDMYQLLSIFFHFPTEELSEGLLNGTLAEDVLNILQELDINDEKIREISAKLGALPGDLVNKKEFLSEIRQEYTRLFTHPKQPIIDIYETLFVESNGARNGTTLFISPAALDAERCYKNAGLVLSKGNQEPADHMATEMEFMMYLYLKKAQALQEDNHEELKRRNEEIGEFVEAHLQKWAKQFFHDCTELSTSNFYKTFGEIGNISIAETFLD